MTDLRTSDGGYLRVTWKPIAGRAATYADLLGILSADGEREWRCVGEGNQCGPHSFLWRDETHDRCGWRLLIPPTEEEA